MQFSDSTKTNLKASSARNVSIDITKFGELTLEQLQRLSWLRGRLEAQLFSACTTPDHSGWDCDWQTAARLSDARWRVVTGELNEGGTVSRVLLGEDWTPRTGWAA